MGSVNGDGLQMKRRTVVKGAAWAAPVVTMGAAAPLNAASPPPVAPELTDGGFCKHSSDNIYHIGVVWNNTLNCQTTVTITSIVIRPNSETDVNVVINPPTFTVEGKGTGGYVYHSEDSPTMANGTATVTYTYTDCDNNEVDAQVPLSVDTLPPCKGINDDL